MPKDKNSTMETEEKFWLALSVVVALVFLVIAKSILGTLMLSIFLYYAARPAHRRLQRYLPTNNFPAIVSVLLIIVPTLILLVYTALVGSNELIKFSRTVDNEAIQVWLQPVLSQLNLPETTKLTPSYILANPWEFVSEDSLTLTRGLLDNILRYAGSISTILLHVFIVLTVTFYLLRDDDKIYSIFFGLFDVSDTGRDFFERLDNRLYEVFFGNVLNALLTAILGAVTFSSLEIIMNTGTGYPVLLGVLCGLGSLIPVVGMKIVYMPVSALLYFWSYSHGNHELFVFATAFTVTAAIIVDIIPDLFIRPFISGRNTHVGALMIAYLIGPLYFGWYGLFLGPLLLVTAITLVDTILPSVVDSGQTKLSEFR